MTSYFIEYTALFICLTFQEWSFKVETFLLILALVMIKQQLK